VARIQVHKRNDGVHIRLRESDDGTVEFETASDGGFGGFGDVPDVDGTVAASACNHKFRFLENASHRSILGIKWADGQQYTREKKQKNKKTQKKNQSDTQLANS
jgi:hypothetical protein